MLLNIQSTYSLLQSTLKIDDYIKYAKDYGYQTIGLADINVLSASYQFVNKCKEVAIKPLLGMKVLIPGLFDVDQLYPFLLYAKDIEGFKQLIHLSKLINQNEFNPDIFWKYLLEETNHLVYLTESKHSELHRYIFNDDLISSRNMLNYLNKCFGNDIYIGVTAYPYNNIEIDKLVSFAETNQLKKIATQAINTLNADQQKSLMILSGIKNNEILSKDILKVTGSNHLLTRSEFQALYNKEKLTDIISETQQLCSKLNVELPKTKSLLPKFLTPNGEESSEYLSDLTHQKLIERIQAVDQNKYKERLNYELKVIIEMGFSDYFLIVADIVDYCHRNDIRIGPGRGSAAGSLVSYLLNITKVDPVAYDLLFERFLNPERFNMPDIDIDIADNRRDKVIHYIQTKYGYDNVAQIATFGSFGAKQSIRDTLRVLGYSTEVQKQWSRLIPTDQNKLMTLNRAYNESEEFRRFIQSSDEHQQLLHIAQTIEGLPRHVSTHAAAVVINDYPLEEIIPVSGKNHACLQTQYTMYDIESIGLLKMDFLGLRNLTLLDSMVKRIQSHINSEFDIEKISFDDKQTLEIFKQANTNGVFQFESAGIKNVLRQLKPDTFEDIVAVIALYRPGPMKQIPEYIRRKHGLETVTYLNEKLRPILSQTYGIIVYQEQIMQMVRTVAGFTYGQSDILRRAMSKKNIELMKTYEATFHQGALKNGYSEQEAGQLFQYILEFSNYGFNRAHAVVYSVLAYQLAYIKAHYPQVFYVEILNAGQSQQTLLNEYIEESKVLFGKLEGVDINQSLIGFSSHNNKILLGFNAIKGLRSDFIEEIINDRNLLGPYQNFINFLQRISKKFLKKEWIELLILSGAFDSLGYQRATLIHNLESLIQTINFSGNNYSLFKEMEPKIIEVKEFTREKLKEIEKEIYGYHLDLLPIQKLNYQIRNHPKLTAIDEIYYKNKGNVISFIGELKRIRQIETKTNQLMAFLTFSNEISEVNVVCFPNQYQRYSMTLRINEIFYIQGKVDLDRKNEKQIILNHIELFEEKHLSTRINKKYCYIKLASFDIDTCVINQIKALSYQQKGEYLIILLDHMNQAIQLSSKYKLSKNQSTIHKLEQIISSDSFRFVD